MNDYDPNTLPEIDAVEVVDLRRISTNRVSQFMQSSLNAPSILCSEEDTTSIVTAWRELPQGISARCHIPPVGFRFISCGDVWLAASVCWRCNNIYGIENGIELSYAFDSEAEVAQSLLSLAQSIIGADVIGDG